MAELNLFRFTPGDSALHRMDPRFKLAGLILISLTAGLADGWSGVALVTLFLAWTFRRSRLPRTTLLRELRRFVWLFAFILAARSFGHPEGEAGFWGFSRAGFAAGLLFDWRLMAVLAAALLLAATTPLTELRNGLLWFLHPLPWLPAARIGTMFSLTFALVPLLFEQAEAVREAQIARSIESVKNPLRRLTSLAWPVLRETFLRADELILAMEARCYTEQRSRPVFRSAAADRLSLGLMLALMVLVAACRMLGV
ncbi:biotin transport system permease protein [Hydrogenispora ethanolica]|uniref:Biotin transport system permease protein n=1 Tax=Hydrogenispora ethanolica TaxID=1082276 RepID=A0A4R1S3I9_HYDET|nr:energy-coupling factor transporter transmembrane component T [Hydrogenispora ethanolica]TCL73190.1 biotin transport system permease protein [Hydrogenispora ethanolica]